MDIEVLQTAFNLVFVEKEDDDHKLSSDFQYKGHTFNYIKENYQEFELDDLSSILILYDIGMNYKDHGTVFFSNVSHKQKVYSVSSHIADFLNNNTFEIGDDDNIIIIEEEHEHLPEKIIPLLANMVEKLKTIENYNDKDDLSKAQTLCDCSHDIVYLMNNEEDNMGDEEDNMGQEEDNMGQEEDNMGQEEDNMGQENDENISINI